MGSALLTNHLSWKTRAGLCLLSGFVLFSQVNLGLSLCREGDDESMGNSALRLEHSRNEALRKFLQSVCSAGYLCRNPETGKTADYDSIRKYYLAQWGLAPTLLYFDSVSEWTVADGEEASGLLSEMGFEPVCRNGTVTLFRKTS